MFEPLLRSPLPTTVVVFVAVTLPVAAFCAGLVLAGSPGFDWEIYVRASELVGSGRLYAWEGDYGYVYSPVFAWLFGLIAWIGLDAWRFAHIFAALLMPTWPMRLLMVVSWPFWFEMQYGNLVVFIVLVAAWAIRGQRWAEYTYLGLALLIPRPLMLPVAGWLLWQRPSTRRPFAALFVIHLVLVGASGEASGWLQSLSGTPEVGTTSDVNFGPTRFLGAWWLAIGVPAAAWFTARSHLGLAALAISPYLLPQYFLFALLELHPRGELPASRDLLGRGSSVGSRHRTGDAPMPPANSKQAAGH